MWNVLAREAAKRIGGTIAANKIASIDEANGPDVYADRIKRDFHLHDYADACALYDSDRAYWQNYYHPRPNSPAWSGEFVRDSAAAAGVPSRNNAFEYGFSVSDPVWLSMGQTPSARRSNTLFMPQNGSTPAGGLAGQTPAFVGTNPNWPPQLRPGDSLPSLDVFTTGAPPVPFLPPSSQRVPRGLPAMLAELGAFDPSNPDAQPSGGLPGLFQEYLRNR